MPVYVHCKTHAIFVEDPFNFCKSELTVISMIGNFNISTVNSIYLIYKTNFRDFLFSEKKIANSTLRTVLA
jgi:hypothetical protein